MGNVNKFEAFTRDTSAWFVWSRFERQKVVDLVLCWRLKLILVCSFVYSLHCKNRTSGNKVCGWDCFQWAGNWKTSCKLGKYQLIILVYFMYGIQDHHY